MTKLICNKFINMVLLHTVATSLELQSNLPFDLCALFAYGGGAHVWHIVTVYKARNTSLIRNLWGNRAGGGRRGGANKFFFPPSGGGEDKRPVKIQHVTACKLSQFTSKFISLSATRS